MRWIVPLLLIGLIAGCSSPQNQTTSVDVPKQEVPAVDLVAKKKQDVAIFVHNNAANLSDYAMKFAKPEDLTKEIKRIASAQPDKNAKIQPDADGWQAPAFLQPEDILDIYQNRQFAPIFLASGDFNDNLKPLIDEFMRLPSHGLASKIDAQPWMDAKKVLDDLNAEKSGSNNVFEFTPEEEQIIVDYIIEHDIDVSKGEAVRDLVVELVKSETIMPRLHQMVVDRAKNLVKSARQTARVDVLTADLAMQFAREMTFNNMTHLSETESETLGANPSPKDYIPIAAARTHAWMNNLVAVIDAPTPELKEKQADVVPDVQETAENTQVENNTKDATEDDDAGDITDAGVDEAKDAHEAEIAAAEEQKERLQNAHSVQELVDALYPAHPGYQQLMQARDKYAEMQDWKSVDQAPLKKGRSAKIVPALRQRLAIEGYYKGDVTDNTSDVYDDELRAAVHTYHETHQLAYDEEKGLQKAFWQSLNTPRSDRLAQIEENLRRWHNTQIIQSPYYIFINVPDFYGEVWRDGQRVYRFPIVVGNSRRSCDPKTKTWKYINATPLMHARMLYLEYNPYWIVPPRIEQEDYIEKINADPNWLQEHGFEYYTEAGRTTLRQLPSEKNALGRVKFIFPNPNSTFLHDSPQKGLFRYPVRAFSHGCMRVWEPLKLAELLLKYDGQWKDKIEKDIEDLETRRFMFKTRFDVFIDYFNVRIDDDGTVNFLADPYHYIRDALNPPSPASIACVPKQTTWIPRTRGDVGADIEPQAQ